MKRIRLFLDTSLHCIVIAWKISKRAKGIHYHLVGFNEHEQYDIIWKHLHFAQYLYERELDDLYELRLKEQQKRNRKGGRMAKGADKPKKEKKKAKKKK